MHMIHAKEDMLTIVRNQLAYDLNCKPEDLLQDGITFCEAISDKGIWLDERQTPHLKVLTMGKGIIVSADSSVLKKVRPILEDMFRDNLFSAPFLFGHSLYYIPDGEMVAELPCPDGITLEVREGSEIPALYACPGFDNAIRYDSRHPRPDALVYCAVHKGEVVGMAGACADSKAMWQIGIDVHKEFRGHGLAACLVTRLSNKILQRGIVPFYGTASSNVASQAVAYRCGFSPAWMCNYQHTLDDKSPFQEHVQVIFR